MRLIWPLLKLKTMINQLAFKFVHQRHVLGRDYLRRSIHNVVMPQYCSVKKNKLNKINVLNRQNTPSSALSEQY